MQAYRRKVRDGDPLCLAYNVQGKEIGVSWLKMHVRWIILLFAVPNCSETLTVGRLIGGPVVESCIIA